MSDLDKLKVEAAAVDDGRKYKADATFKNAAEGLLFSEANLGTTSAPKKAEQQNTWSLGVVGNARGAIDGIQVKFESAPSKGVKVLGTTTQDYQLADGTTRKIELPSISTKHDAGVDRAGLGVTAIFKPTDLATSPKIIGTPFVGVAVGENAKGQVAGTVQAGMNINGGITMGAEVRVDKTPGKAINTTVSPLIDTKSAGNVLGSTMDRLYAPTPVKHDASLLKNLDSSDKKLQDPAGSSTKTSSLENSAHAYNKQFASALIGLEDAKVSGDKKDMAATLVLAGANAGFDKEGSFKVIAGTKDNLIAIQGDGPAALRASVARSEVQPGALQTVSDLFAKQTSLQVTAVPTEQMEQNKVRAM